MNRTRLAGLAMVGVILVVATGCPPLVFGDPAPAPPTVAPLLAVGAHHTCAQNGLIFCWGDNSAGQLGNGTTTSSGTPVPVQGITWSPSLSAGGDRTCAVYGVDDNVYCWGDNSTGGLGDGTTTDRSTPTEVPGLFDVKSVSVGDDFTCAVHLAGGVVCWGQVPGVDGGMTTTPVSIAGLEAATAISVGADHACALVAISLECFGDNSFGQLGDGTTTSSATPLVVPGVTDLDAAQAGWATAGFVAAGNHTCAISTKHSTVWCWGDNSSGQLGDGTTTDSSTPVAVPYPSLVYKVLDAGIVAGDGFTCASFTPDLSGTGTPVNTQYGCWGDNSSGQLGDGTTTSRSTFASDPTVYQPIFLAAGGSVACGMSYVATSTYPSPRVASCWGDDSQGQLGDGTTNSSPNPVAVVAAYAKDPPAVKPTTPLPQVTFSSNPKIVIAGQPVTFTVHITHPVGLISNSTGIYVVREGFLPDFWGCGDPNAVTTGTDTDRTITISCTFPAGAPEESIDNGPSLYDFAVSARGVDSPTYSNDFTFYVSSTSTDTNPPRSVSSSVVPSSITLGQPFVISATVTDPKGPISAAPIIGYPDSKPPVDFLSSTGACGPATVDGSAAPQWTWSATCVVTSLSSPSSTAAYAETYITDAFGFRSYQSWSIPVATS